MSGHSKFHNIMFKKGAQDIKRAKIFAKMSREITVAAKLGGNDVNSNPRLRAALSLARGNNMPKDNIERAIAKATSTSDNANYDDVRYEGYGPGGIAVIVETLTDNRKRTASDVRFAFSKFGGNLGETGSVAFSFNRVGNLTYETVQGSFEKVLEIAINLGAENVEEFEGYIKITTPVPLFSSIREAFVKEFGDPIESGLVWQPTTYVPCSEGVKDTLTKLIDTLEDNDDVQNVFHNMEE